MRIYTRSENQYRETKKDELLRSLKNKYSKLYKSQRHNNFLEKCLSHRVFPKCAQLPDVFKKPVHCLTKEESIKLEIRKLEQKIKDQKSKISNFENQFQNNLDSFKLTFQNNIEFDYAVQNMKTRLHRSESFCDKKKATN